MLNRLRTTNRHRETLFLGIATLICFALFLARQKFTGTNEYRFLNWNLFLAFIPWALTSIAVLYPKLARNPLTLIPLIGAWLVFFPNAPYILTDLFHLARPHMAPIWYDLIMVLCFAWIGLLFGYLSLLDLENILKRILPKNLVPVIVSILLFASSFGIYLGRFLRWNSWDVLQEPTDLLYDIGTRIANPFDHPRTWGMTLLMGLLLNLIYWSLKLFKNRQQQPKTPIP